jgi:glycosyltransferase involved in cell wall biosynthesis
MLIAEHSQPAGGLKVLHVTNWPGPPFDGGRINRYHVLKRLSPRHRFRFVILRETQETAAMNSQSLAELGIGNEGVCVIERPRMSAAARLREFVSSRRPPGVAFLERCAGSRLRAAVEAATAQWEPDALMVWSPNWAGLLAPTARHLQRVLFACDCLSMLHRNIAASSSSPLRSAYHREVARRYARYEQAFYPQYGDVVFVGSRDVTAASLPPQLPVHVIPNGVDSDQLRPLAGARPQPPPRVVFHGHLGYVANETAVRFLAEVVGPQLATRLGQDGFEIRILGGAAGRSLQQAVSGKPWLTLAGYVPDLAAELSQATVYAAPLAMGGGIKNKVLEAMACGLPVVGTREAFEALPVRPGIDVVESPLEVFAGQVLQLLDAPNRRAELGRAARQCVVRHSNWDRVAESFEQLFQPRGTPARAEVKAA